MPAADRPIVAAVQLPEHYVITPAEGRDPGRLLDELDAVLAAGTRLIQLRVFGLEAAAHLELAREAVARCKAFAATLMVNADAELARAAGAHGVHLNARQLLAMNARPEGFERVGASCHNPGELARALELGLDFVVLSPVMPTPSHPDAVPLGWERFQEWVDEIPMPVFALGGMRPGLLGQAREAGAQGLAGISGFWAQT